MMEDNCQTIHAGFHKQNARQKVNADFIKTDITTPWPV